VATALVSATQRPLASDALRDRVQALSRLFKYEFTFRADTTFARIFDDTVAAMLADNELTVDAKGLITLTDEAVVYAAMLESFVEGYRVAARSLGLLVRGPMTPKDLTKKALGVGQRMFLAGDIQRREAISGPLIENALEAFIDLEYVNRSDGKLELPESFASAPAAATIEAKIARFLTTR